MPIRTIKEFQTKNIIESKRDFVHLVGAKNIFFAIEDSVPLVKMFREEDVRCFDIGEPNFSIR